MSKYKMKNRFVSMVLATLMLVTGVMPTAAFAQEMPTSKTLPAVTENVESTPVESEEVTSSSNEEVPPSNETTATEEAVEETAPATEISTEEVTSSSEKTTEETSAPEGKEFKSWLMGEEELKEGHKLAADKDIELKANWDDTKVNPTKEALDSLFGKEDTEELDIGEELVGKSVMSDGEYTGPANNSVVSSDGKVQIRNFEVFWANTEEDTVVDSRDWVLGYGTNRYDILFSKFNYEPKMQINWALSGEVQYPKGAMTITIPDMKFENENDLKYPIKGYSIPELKFKEDGSIDFNANYGNATLAYYYNKDEVAYKITNIKDLAPGASGTFTLTYGDYAGNSRWLKDMSIHESKPVIDLKYNDEVLKTQDKSLKIQQDTKIGASVSKQGKLFKTWQDDWGTGLKPENSEDYWYVCYQISVSVYDYLQANYDINLTDMIGDIYEHKNDWDASRGQNPQKTIKNEQEIISYTDLSEKPTTPVFTNPAPSKDKIEWQFKVDFDNNETKKDTYANKNVYKKNEGKSYYSFAYRYHYVHVLTKIPARKLGYMDEKKSHYISVRNDVKLELTPKNSDDDIFTKTAEAITSDSYTYVPDAKFTAPPGDSFSLKKYVKDGDGKTYGSTRWKRDSSSSNGKLVIPTKYHDEGDDLYSEKNISWKIESTSRVANETYDSSYGDKNNEDAYGKKKVKYEIVDDYLYLGDDYSKELTSEDYSVREIGFWISLHDYSFYKSETESDYRYQQVYDTFPASLYLRKDSTGEWINAVDFKVSSERTKYDDVYYKYTKNAISDVNIKIDGLKYEGLKKRNPNDTSRSHYVPVFTIPDGYTSAKLVFETNHHGMDASMLVEGALKPSERVKKAIDNSANGDCIMDIVLRNDPTMAVYNEENNLIGLQGTTKANANVDRTLELDRENYDTEMYHAPVLVNLKQIKKPEINRSQTLQKILDKDRYYIMNEKQNDPINKQFLVPAQIIYTENVGNVDINKADPLKQIHEQNSGTFYDLLPFGVTGVENVGISGSIYEYNKYSYVNYYADKSTGSTDLKTSYELIPNWRNSGRTMLIARFDNAELKMTHKNDYHNRYYAELRLDYTMTYPWDSYKDYGSRIDRNLVAYESGFEKRPDDGLDDSLTSELESGHGDDPIDTKDSWGKKLFTDQEIEWMKNLNPNHDEKRFLYAQASTTVSGDTEANVGLTKHVSTDINPNFTLKSATKEGGNYQYKIRLQAAHGTSVSNLVFFDSIENYDPLQADEDYGVKQWRGTLSSIDLNHPIMKGIEPKVYVSTTPKLDIEKHNDVSDSTIWKLYKEGDDLSNVQAVAIDLRKNKDGSDFKLEQDTAINVYLNMKAPWNLKEKQIDPKAKALNAIYASNTVTTSLDNSSTKLIYTAYTAVDLEPVTTETQIKAIKKHLDKDGKDIALKGDDFTFELKDSEGNVLQTKTNDAKGDITFDPIKYNSWDVGEHTYKIVEVKGDSETTAYDNHEEIVKVNVEREGNSNLKATITYDEDGATFTNHEVDPITTSLEAKKVYIGKGGQEEKPTAGAFEFILKDAEGTEVAKVKNDAEGKVVFEGLEFKPNEIGEHKYTIEEIKGNNPAIEYDNTKKNVTIHVSLTEDFKLKADVVYEGGEIPTFTNTLKSASLQLVKLKGGSDTFILDEVKDENGFLTSYKVPEAQKDSVLDGAEYELYKLTEGKEELVATLITKSGISQVVQDIMPGKYKLKETKAPKGYTLNDKDLIFDITDKDAGTIVTKFVTDDGIVDMPSTGGQGTKALMIGGGILVTIMAGVLVVANKKKKEQLNK